jgi:hypothetical protein
VPIDRVTSVTDKINLSCTKNEFEWLEAAEVSRFLPAAGDELNFGVGTVLALPYLALGKGGLQTRGWDTGIGGGPSIITYDRVPTGEVEVRRGDAVHATDGTIGSVQGLVIDPSDHHVTHVLLNEGHLWGKKEVAIPISAVTRVVEDGAWLSLTKDEVRDLPPVDIEHLN